MYSKNDEIQVVIDGLGNEGEGIAHIDGFPFFIKDTAIGDRVRAQVMKVKKNLGFARLITVEEPSKDRIRPECPVSRSCGGCTLQHISYEAELKYKEDKVFNCLQRLGGVDIKDLEEAREGICKMDYPFRYRNKAQYPIGINREGKAIAGFYSGRTHSITEEEDCRLSPPEFGQILRIILDFIDEYGIGVYDEASGQGLFRHVFIRKGFNTGEIMVCLVLTSDKLPRETELVNRLKDFPGISSICINVNPDKTNVILGDRIRLLFGKPYIEDILCGLRFRISPLSFYQVNPVMTEKLYKKAMEYAGLFNPGFSGELLDICCGIGTISLYAASLAKNGIIRGIEIVPEAVKDAEENAGLNGIKNAFFTAAAAEDFLPSRAASKEPFMPPKAVIADPPRKGLKPETLDALATLSPERIVYISCDPATLARDIKFLSARGYRLKNYKVFDQFARTGHVETVCLLSNRKPDSYVHLNLKMEDYYRIKDAQKEQDKK